MDEQVNFNEEPPLTINLNGNKLKFNDKGKWELEVSDLDLVTFEIENLVSDKEKLALALQTTLNQVDSLNKEINEINKMKALALEMLMQERQQRIALENEVTGYKEELRNSYKTIVELREKLSKYNIK